MSTLPPDNLRTEHTAVLVRGIQGIRQVTCCLSGNWVKTGKNTEFLSGRPIVTLRYQGSVCGVQKDKSHRRTKEIK